MNKIEINGFEKSGVHEMTIYQMTDGNGCTWDMSEQSVMIDIRKSRPTVQFKGSLERYYLDTETPEFEVEMIGM